MKMFTEAELNGRRFREVMARISVPRTLKIGIDVGITLEALSKSYERRFFVGVEIKPERAELAAKRLTKAGCKNALVINMEALRYLQRCRGEERFEEMLVLFPTPYPKALRGYPFRLKSRLINMEFEKCAYDAIVPGGSIRIVTDHGQYFDQVQGTFPDGRWWPVAWRPIDIGQPVGHLVGTGCEIDFRRRGQEIFYVQLVRK